MAEAGFDVHDYGFEALAPAGYYLAVRVGFAFPEFEYNGLPRAWVLWYTRSGLIMHDPVMRWIYENNGAVRWSDIDIADGRGVLAQAAEYGLRFGAAVCLSGEESHGLRSFATFCRSDREISDDELDDLTGLFRTLHQDLSPPDDITDAEIEALRLVQEGLLLKEAAYRLGISEGAVKQRLRSAKSKLNARTNTQAVSKAATFGLI